MNELGPFDLLLVVFEANVGVKLDPPAFVIEVLSWKIHPLYFHGSKDETLVPYADSASNRAVQFFTAIAHIKAKICSVRKHERRKLEKDNGPGTEKDRFDFSRHPQIAAEIVVPKARKSKHAFKHERFI